MSGFAVVSDLQALGAKLQLDPTLDPVAALALAESIAQTVLDAASEHLRLIIGPLAIPSKTVTVTLHQYQGDRWLVVPIPMVRSITAMTVTYAPGGIGYTVTAPQLIDGSVEVCGPCDVTLTLVVGTDTIPQELKNWTCILAAEALSSLGELGTFGSAAVTSIAMEDYKKTWSVAGGAFDLPPRVEDLLRNRYGSGVTVVGVR